MIITPKSLSDMLAWIESKPKKLHRKYEKVTALIFGGYLAKAAELIEKIPDKEDRLFVKKVRTVAGEDEYVSRLRHANALTCQNYDEMEQNARTFRVSLKDLTWVQANMTKADKSSLAKNPLRKKRLTAQQEYQFLQNVEGRIRQMAYTKLRYLTMIDPSITLEDIQQDLRFVVLKTLRNYQHNPDDVMLKNILIGSIQKHVCKINRHHNYKKRRVEKPDGSMMLPHSDRGTVAVEENYFKQGYAPDRDIITPSIETQIPNPLEVLLEKEFFNVVDDAKSKCSEPVVKVIDTILDTGADSDHEVATDVVNINRLAARAQSVFKVSRYKTKTEFKKNLNIAMRKVGYEIGGTNADGTV